MILEDYPFEGTGTPRVFKTTEAQLEYPLNAMLDVGPQ
jgi:hypothetical protein